jgi:hypothetical protein
MAQITKVPGSACVEVRTKADDFSWLVIHEANPHALQGRKGQAGGAWGGVAAGGMAQISGSEISGGGVALVPVVDW